MAHRLLVNVIFTGASVFGRAFTEAYRQAAKASAAGAAGRPAKASSAGGIPVEEAMKILDLEKSELSLDKVEEIRIFVQCELKRTREFILSPE